MKNIVFLIGSLFFPIPKRTLPVTVSLPLPHPDCILGWSSSASNASYFSGSESLSITFKVSGFGLVATQPLKDEKILLWERDP